MFKRRKQTVSREQSLTSIPVHNQVIREECGTDGCVTLLVPVRRTGVVKMLGKILNVPETDRRVSLDKLGSYVWRMCDGQTTVRDLIERFSRKYKLDRKEAEVSMVAYLRMLAKRRLVGIVVPEEQAT